MTNVSLFSPSKECFVLQLAFESFTLPQRPPLPMIAKLSCISKVLGPPSSPVPAEPALNAWATLTLTFPHNSSDSPPFSVWPLQFCPSPPVNILIFPLRLFVKTALFSSFNKSSDLSVFFSPPQRDVTFRTSLGAGNWHRASSISSFHYLCSNSIFFLLIFSSLNISHITVPLSFLVSINQTMDQTPISNDRFF